ncbi:hypothetical protein J2X31_001108 [Flavobacterium arsenatis]|uniref:Lipocalin-like domain-containing protein n=1 Tax=Flavobacterium arsenatis TaxID=1484332 RepID=A0ABU1TMC3_9FLAO|nr:hypothetical protein [Flavobacterium arsenatis]MDR6967101.1 hypothetical protein [Flavobacterium arsenatis]
MKITNLIIVAFLLVFLSSCCNNDDGNPVNQQIEGKWHLVQVSGGFVGINHVYEPGTISWEFNPSTNKLKVINTNTDDNMQDIFDTGTYDYGFQLNTATPEICPENILLNSIDYGCYTISSNNLIISQVETDGFLIKLIRF